MSDSCQFLHCIRIHGKIVHSCRCRKLREVQLRNDTITIITKIC